VVAAVVAAAGVAGCDGCSLGPARAIRTTGMSIGRLRIVLRCPPFGDGGIASRDP
jgi:putative component of membrane protein insertase Oxa1/YidC/SpoIIIJ protein YidD